MKEKEFKKKKKNQKDVGKGPFQKHGEIKYLLKRRRRRRRRRKEKKYIYI